MELAVILIFLILSVIVGIYRPRIKGFIGEFKVSATLKFLNNRTYKVINDILLKPQGRSSQIDHIVVSEYGIFVIETKNYKGWIHGHENSEYWTHSIYKRKYKFRNPILQTKGHIRTLKSVLKEYNNISYFPIVVFTGGGKLKNVYSNVPVIYTYRLLNTIKKTKGLKCLTLDEVNQISEKLNQSNVPGRKARKNHIRKAKTNVRKQKKREKSSLCPRCGGSLVLRKGQHGKFYGCSNFPKCRYSRNIKRRFI